MRDYNGTAIKDAKVECVDTGDYDWTNAAGYYSFITREGIGEYTLKALKPYYGYVPVEHDVSAAAGTHQVNFTLPCIAEIFVAYDAEFSNEYPDEQAEIDDIMNMVEGYYSHEGNLLVDFDVFGYEECDICTSTNAEDLLNQLKAKWNTNTSLDRDLIHLFSGKDLDGGVVGIAIQPGLEYPVIHGYSLSQHIDMSDYKRSMVVAHEIGHNFYGKHALHGKMVEAAISAESMGVYHYIQNTL